MNTLTEKLAEALRGLLDAPSPCDCGIQGCSASDCRTTVREAAETTARTTLAEYEAAPRGYIPADYIREKLEKYDSEIADGTVSYPFYAGVFSQVARGMLERIA